MGRLNHNKRPAIRREYWPMIAAIGNVFPARKALPDPRTHDAMAGFLTYRLILWPPSQMSPVAYWP